MAEAGMRLNAAAMLMRVGGSIPAAQSRVLWKHHLCSHLTQLLVSLGTQKSLKGCSDWDVWIIAEKRDKNGIDWLDNVGENSMCTNWLMIEGTAFTTSSTFPDVKPRDLVFQRPIISQLFIESGYIYLTAGTGSLKMGRKNPSRPCPSIYTYRH